MTIRCHARVMPRENFGFQDNCLRNKPHEVQSKACHCLYIDLDNMLAQWKFLLTFLTETDHIVHGTRTILHGLLNTQMVVKLDFSMNVGQSQPGCLPTFELHLFAESSYLKTGFASFWTNFYLNSHWITDCSKFLGTNLIVPTTDSKWRWTLEIWYF